MASCQYSQEETHFLTPKNIPQHDTEPRLAMRKNKESGLGQHPSLSLRIIYCIAPWSPVIPFTDCIDCSPFSSCCGDKILGISMAFTDCSPFSSSCGEKILGIIMAFIDCSPFSSCCGEKILGISMAFTDCSPFSSSCVDKILEISMAFTDCSPFSSCC